MKLIVRDGFATLNKDKTTHEMLSGSVDIVAEDENTLFSIKLLNDGSIEVDAGSCCKVNGVMTDDVFSIVPISVNRIKLQRPEYK